MNQDPHPRLTRTKLYRPHVTGHLVERPLLLERLRAGLQHRLTLISAPAGFGKTTLAAAWLASLDRPAAWVSLDENDNDPVVFLSYFIAAIRTLFADASQDTLERLCSPGPPRVDRLSDALSNDIAELPQPFVLALDDYHLIQDPDVHKVVARLVEQQPPQLHLVIIARSDPPFPLARLRARKQVTDVRARDLSFSADEAEHFLRLAVSSRLDHDTAVALNAHLEGWIAGLQLVALSLRGREDFAAFLQEFQEQGDRFITDYLVSEVLEHQPDGTHQFLLQTSLLEGLSADLCAAVTGQTTRQAAHLLDQLERAGLFLTRFGQERGWYRYHSLFQEMLRQRLHARTSPDDLTILRRRAAHGCAQQGLVDEALKLFLAAGDVASAADLVEQHRPRMLNYVERHAVERWLSLLPNEVLWQRSGLLMAKAWQLYRQFRIHSLAILLGQADQGLGLGQSFESNEQRPAYRGLLAMFQSVVALLLSGGFRLALGQSEQAMAWLPIAERDARGLALLCQGLGLQAVGQYDVARQRLLVAIQDPTGVGPEQTQAFLGLTLIQLLAGDLDELQRTTRRFQAFAAGTGLANVLGAAHWVSGLLQYELNNLLAAKDAFAQVIAHRHGTNLMAVFSSMLGLIRICQARSDLLGAQATIDELQAQLAVAQTDFVQAALDSVQARQWILTGQMGTALRWARSLPPGTGQEPLVYFFEVPSLTRARVLAIYGSDDDLPDVVQDLQKRATTARANHHTQRAVQVLGNLALAQDRLGEPAEAHATLTHALQLAEPGGLVRSLVDCGHHLLPLLHHLYRQGRFPDYLPHLMAAVSASIAPEAAATPRPAAPSVMDLITPREAEVLRLMEAGLTNQEIADRLVISPYTVKRHATNIFNKLAVRNRRQAVRRARQVGLLTSN